MIALNPVSYEASRSMAEKSVGAWGCVGVVMTPPVLLRSWGCTPRNSSVAPTRPHVTGSRRKLRSCPLLAGGLAGREVAAACYSAGAFP